MNSTRCRGSCVLCVVDALTRDCVPLLGFSELLQSSTDSRCCFSNHTHIATGLQY